MKKLLLTLSFLLSVLCSYAQDIIIKKNGDEISAKIIELTPTLIKYRHFDYQDGPIISLLKSEVFLIKYANGAKETFGTNLAPAPAPAQTPTTEQYPAIRREMRLDGPRLGFTVISGTQGTWVREEFNINPFITQIGWQFETRMFTTAGGLSGLAEFVPLIGGLEQGRFLPSLNGIVGLRTAKGFEFGVGPSLALAGVGLVFAVGTNFYSQGLNFPVNAAVVPTKDGVRFSLLFGFNSRKN